MKYILRNQYRNEVIPCDSFKSLEEECIKQGINVSTVIKAKREGRDTLTGWELLSNEDIKAQHLFDMMERQDKESRVLVIGDLHEPFCLEGYREFCKEVYDKYKCNKVVFIGDILDNHVSSYHENDLDSDGINLEFDKAYREIQRWYKLFPEAIVTFGNHDVLPKRKSQTASIGKHWLKEFKDVLDTPGWEYVGEKIIDGVCYVHGVGRQAKNRCLEDNISVVQGHYHSKSYLFYYVNSDGTNKFAMQIGCGVDRNSYAMAYGKHFARPHINCGVVINGKKAYLEYMEGNDVRK